MYAQIKPLIKLKKELNLLDYIIPPQLKIKAGQLVEIPFRHRNIYGIVFSIQNNTQQAEKTLKSINKIIISSPLFSQNQIEFYNFFVEHNFSSLNFLNHITPLPLKRKTSVKNKKINITKTAWKIKKISSVILKNKQFIFKHNYFSEKISLIKKTIDRNQRQTLVISPTKLHLEKIYSYLLNFYASKEIVIITGNTHLNKTIHNRTWYNIQDNKIKIILGTKTSIFYPLNNVDSIIIDEAENENHNQSDINPRFQLESNILKLSQINNCQLIFSTYAPPTTLYYLAQQKKIKFLESKAKSDTQIKIYEMNIKYFENQIHFNSEEHINNTLAKRKKILFLINKKGFSKNLYCKDCGYLAQCPKCNNILTYLKEKNILYCYHCQEKKEVFLQCPRCTGTNLKFRGIGSSQLFKKVKKSFPNQKTILIDQDHPENLKKIKNSEIVIATNFIINHLNDKDFDLIILPLSHQFLNNDYNANEKFYQFIKKLIALQPHTLILQIFNELPIYQAIQKQNYFNFIKDELSVRRLFHYPPFYKIIKITIKDKETLSLEKKANYLYQKIKNNLPLSAELLDIITPQIKSFNFYSKYIMIKYPLNTNLKKLKPILKTIDIIEQE